MQVEYRLPMLCERSGFIFEAMDYLAALHHTAHLPSPHHLTRLNLTLTGLHGDCAGLSSTMTAAQAELLRGLRAHAGTELDSGTSGNCMMAKAKDGSNSYTWVCDRDEVEGEGGDASSPLPPIKSVVLQSGRVAIEHGLVCGLRKRGFFDDGGYANTLDQEAAGGLLTYEEHYGTRPDVFVARCMTESSEISKKVGKRGGRAG